MRENQADPSSEKLGSQSRSEQELVRFKKLEALRAISNPFPNDCKVNASSLQVIDSTSRISSGMETPTLNIAGRVVTLRHMGKASFFHLLDSEGRVQVYVKKEQVGEECFTRFLETDIGDIVEVIGQPFITKTGEPTLAAKSVRLLTKALIPLPEKWHGLSDIETRYRQRYLDLIANPEVRETFKTRARIIRYIRSFLDDRGFLEVETPVLQSVAGGASARPFITHHNALNLDMYLRIALELPLKKLIVGGLERVYEIGRIFRNEGISKKHNPEFTMLEFYQAYATFNDLMNLTEELLSGLVQNLHNSFKIKYAEHEIDFTPPWPRLSMQESIHEIGGISRQVDLSDLNQIIKVAKEHNIELTEASDWGRSLEALWGELVEPKITNPVFITHHPLSISPLARSNSENPLITDRFELIIAGMETANAFSELNDAIDQRERFEEQARRKAGGDQEAPDVEQDFLRALEHGMPPTAGQGIGIDRLVMLLTNSASIRDVVLFPQLKPEV